MKQVSNEYLEGFVAKCAEFNVNPEALSKVGAHFTPSAYTKALAPLSVVPGAAGLAGSIGGLAGLVAPEEGGQATAGDHFAGGVGGVLGTLGGALAGGGIGTALGAAVQGKYRNLAAAIGALTGVAGGGYAGQRAGVDLLGDTPREAALERFAALAPKSAGIRESLSRIIRGSGKSKKVAPSDVMGSSQLMQSAAKAKKTNLADVQGSSQLI